MVIAGRGENYDDMNVIYISPDEVSVEGASEDVEKEVSIADYLPTGVIFAAPDTVTNVKVTVGIAQNQHKTIDVPLSNITVDNVPEGYVANIVDIGPAVSVEIQGIGDEFDRYSGDLAIGSIDASTLVSRSGHEAGTMPTGECDGSVVFDFPTGVSLSSPVTLMVIVDHIGTAEDTGTAMPTAGAAIAE